MAVEKIGNKWRAKAYILGKQVHLGMFKTKREATEAVLQARSEIYTGINTLELVDDIGKLTLLQRVKRWLKK